MFDVVAAVDDVELTALVVDIRDCSVVVVPGIDRVDNPTIHLGIGGLTWKIKRGEKLT